MTSPQVTASAAINFSFACKMAEILDQRWRPHTEDNNDCLIYSKLKWPDECVYCLWYEQNLNTCCWNQISLLVTCTVQDIAGRAQCKLISLSWSNNT